MMLKTERIKEFQKIVLSHFDRQGRMFRWRKTRNPYEILVSELMLQQTQTERVIPKYDAFLKTFPTVEVLARAPLSQVLEMWSGLGYNRRARFLHNACKKITDEYQGVFPKTAKELEKLPGVGAYTSCAVSTFAFGNPEVFIETNIRSVFIFFFFSKALSSSDTVIHDKDLMPLIEQCLYKDNPRLWYYALMDYGSELKKKIQNPNRKSAHYTKQSKFEGSLRQARGAVLRQLTTVAKNLNIASIAKNENIDEVRIKEAVFSLQKEGFICCDGNEVYVVEN